MESMIRIKGIASEGVEVYHSRSRWALKIKAGVFGKGDGCTVNQPFCIEASRRSSCLLLPVISDPYMS